MLEESGLYRLSISHSQFFFSIRFGNFKVALILCKIKSNRSFKISFPTSENVVNQMNVLYCFILKKKLCINSSSTKTFQWFSIYAFVNSAFVAYLSSHHSSALSHWKASLQHYGISSAFYVLLNWISLHSFQGGLKSEPARATFIMAVCRYEYWGTLYEYDVIPKAVAKKLQFLSDGSLAFRFNVGKLLCFLRVFQAFRYGSQPVL